MQASRGHRHGAVTLLIFMSCLFGFPHHPGAATAPAESDLVTSSLPLPEAPYDQRAFVTKAGTEGFELAARLREGGNLIARPIAWRVYRLLTGANRGGELVYEGEAPIADFLSQPGEYRIDLEYGLARFSRVISLEAKQRLSVVFNLDMGGLRVLSRLAAPPPARFQTSHRIYSLSGADRMRLVADNAVPGDLLRLPAGRYRVESELVPGNAVARSDVEVKAGMLSAVEIDHLAGIASLAIEGTPHAAVTWQILDHAGRVAAKTEGSTSDVVLAPGTYKVEVAFGAATLVRTITVAAGKRVEVTFP
ncbi:MAG TPA: hypothetical protein VIB38_07200 [Aestuariivirgaceae bacterium]